MKESSAEVCPAARRPRRIALVAAALCAFALVPVSATAAYAGEDSSSSQQSQQSRWISQGIHTDANCDYIGRTVGRDHGWSYKCEWHPPIQYGYSELFFYI